MANDVKNSNSTERSVGGPSPPVGVVHQFRHHATNTYNEVIGRMNQLLLPLLVSDHHSRHISKMLEYVGKSKVPQNTTQL